MPLRFGRSGSVRASSRHQSACIPPLAHSFWPLTTNVSPSLRAVVRRHARSEPASGSEKPCTQISPSRIAGRCRAALLLGARDQQGRRGVVDADERQHQSRRVVGGQLLSTARSARRPTCRRPIRPASAGQRIPRLCNSANHDFWNATNSASPDSFWASRQSRGTCSAHQSRTCCRNSSSWAVMRHSPGGRSIARATETPSSNDGAIWRPVRNASTT